jgi:hypothetical protein
VALALCALTLAAYSNSFGAGFVFDNKGLLLQDPRIRDASFENLGLILQHTYWRPHGESGLYRPLATYAKGLSARSGSTPRQDARIWRPAPGLWRFRS